MKITDDKIRILILNELLSDRKQNPEKKGMNAGDILNCFIKSKEFNKAFEKLPKPLTLDEFLFYNIDYLVETGFIKKQDEETLINTTFRITLEGINYLESQKWYIKVYYSAKEIIDIYSKLK